MYNVFILHRKTCEEEIFFALTLKILLTLSIYLKDLSNIL